MEFNLVMYLIGVLLSIAFGLRGIGMFDDNIKYGIKDVVFVLITSLIFHWLGALVFGCGYGQPQTSHPDVI
jgi:hypothetical protein